MHHRHHDDLRPHRSGLAARAHRAVGTDTRRMNAATAPTALREHLDEYLAVRRGLGYRLDKLEHLASQFCDWLAAQGKTTTFSTADAVAGHGPQPGPTTAGGESGSARSAPSPPTCRPSASRCRSHLAGCYLPGHVGQCPTSTPRQTWTRYARRVRSCSPTGSSPTRCAPSSACWP